MKWPKSISQYKAVIVVGLMVATLFMFNLQFVFWAIDEVSSSEPSVSQLLFSGIIWGTFIGQMNLIAVWGAMADGSLLTRIPWSVLLLVVLWMSYVGGRHLVSDGQVRFYVDDLSVVIFGAYLALGCLVAHLLLWVASFWWVISDRRDSAESGRFELNQMFLCIVILALTLAAARIVARPDRGRELLWDTNAFLDFDYVSWFLTMLIGNLTLVMPCIWLAFRRGVSVNGLVATIGGIVVVSTVLFDVNCWFQGMSFHVVWKYLMYPLGSNLGQVAIVYVCLRILKDVAGFRLLRRSEQHV